MDQPNVLIGLTYYFPNISGVSLYAVILAEELVKRKYKVEVLTSRHESKLSENEKLNGVTIKRITGFKLGKGFMMPYYGYESFKEVQKYDIINCHLPSIESFWLALWSKLFNKKLVVTHHCEFGFDGPISNKLIALLSYPIHLFTYFMADTIIAYTKDYADHSMFLKMFKKKVNFILPPIKIKKLQSTNFPPRRAGKLQKREKTVGFVGRIAWEKGLEVLLGAMKKVDAKLILVGPYKDVAGDETYKKLKNVEFIGPIDHDKLNKYYEMFDCLVLPSTNNLETFGIVQPEAMLCGCPVVASNLPGVRVPIKMTGMGEIAEIDDVDDLANKINLVLKNGKKYYQKKSKNLEKFNYLLTIDRYEKCFK